MKRVFIFILVCAHSWLYSSAYFSHLSSAWYPLRAKKLQQKLESLEQEAQKKFQYHLNPDHVTALLVPHAGYDYSGVVAAAVYQSIKNNHFKRVILIGPSHFVHLETIAIPELSYEFFHNSLGSVALDTKILKKLCVQLPSLCVEYQQLFEMEHSLEVQIPFIQKYCPDASIIPIVVGKLNSENITKIAEVLSSYLDQRTLLVATTDLTHFGSAFNYLPFTQNVGINLAKLDQNIINSLEIQSLAEFEQVIQETQAAVCGIYPVELLLKILQKQKIKNDAYVVSYDRSTRDQNPEHSVSYVGMVFSKERKHSLSLQNQFTGYEKKVLKDLSQEVLKNLWNKSYKNDQFNDVMTQVLRQPWGAFVTIYTLDHTLRGCIGRVISDQPLYQTVMDMTRAAAFEDSRFDPVSFEEIPNLVVEISVVNKPKPIDSYEKIRLGVDGIILKYKNKSAVFLPHVPIEQGWDLSTTLTELSRKAGLKADDWKHKNAQFEVFQTIDV